MLHDPVYLDHNSTTACDPRVIEAMLPYFSKDFGNAASRTHAFGWKAAEAVEIAREQVATLIGAETSEIVFTSGATESANLALKGVYEMYAVRGNHIITDTIEHKAVLDSCRHLEKKGADISYVAVENNARIDPDKLKPAFKTGTILLAIMYANNETGTIMPVEEIAQCARRNNVIFFSDATQAVGKIPVDVNKDQIDLMAFNAHKIYGPKGVGALYVRRKNPRVKLSPQIDGGGHERGLRSGTLNVPAIVGFGKACEICETEIKEDAARTAKLRDKLETALLSVEDTAVNGDTVFRMPHVTNISFKGVESETLMMSFNKQIALSSGSACTSATLEPSYVLKAMGLNDEIANSSIRFSLGRYTTEEEIDFTIEEVARNVKRLRKGIESNQS